MASLETVLEAVRDRIEAQVSGLTRAREVDTIRNEPDHLIPGKFAAWPESSRNLRDRRPSSGETTVEDTIVLELGGRLVNVSGAGQAASLDVLLAKCRNVRAALTAREWWGAQAVECVEWISERRQRIDGWVIVRQTYIIRRPAVLG